MPPRKKASKKKPVPRKRAASKRKAPAKKQQDQPVHAIRNFIRIGDNGVLGKGRDRVVSSPPIIIPQQPQMPFSYVEPQYRYTEKTGTPVEPQAALQQPASTGVNQESVMLNEPEATSIETRPKTPSMTNKTLALKLSKSPASIALPLRTARLYPSTIKEKIEHWESQGLNFTKADKRKNKEEIDKMISDFKISKGL